MVRLLVLALALAPMAPLYAADWFVATNGTGNGTSWANATNSIQGAINASSAADTVWVSNGVYAAGGVTNFPAGGLLTNRIAIWKAITVRSANNDPANTIIRGAWNPVTTNGPAAVRCVYMTNGSALIGFTLTNGATLAAGVDDIYAGGVLPQSTNTIISNCVIAGNSAINGGGGVIWGSLFNCTLTGNSALYAGGIYGGILYNCTLTGNSVSLYGGGADTAKLYNSLLTGNSAAGVFGGGGAYNSIMYNCTLTGNSATGGSGGGARFSTLINCIVYFNNATSGGSNWYAVVAFTNTCTTPAATNGVGNTTNDPTFLTNGSGYGTNHVAGNYRLSEGSPARNAGTNFAWMTDLADVRSKDLDGQHRIDGYNRQVDMGCYEYFFRGTIFTMH